MATWVEKNKVFIYTIIVAVFFTGVAWATLHSRIATAEDKVKLLVIKVNAECERSKKVDNLRSPQMARIQADISYLKETSSEVKGSVKDLGTKLEKYIDRDIVYRRENAQFQQSVINELRRIKP